MDFTDYTNILAATNIITWKQAGNISEAMGHLESQRKDTRPYKDRFPEQYCLNCGQWLGGAIACCDDPKGSGDKIYDESGTHLIHRGID